jgi:hypothetical protein
MLFDDGFGYVELIFNTIPEFFVYSNQMLIVQGSMMIKKFKVESVISNAQLTLDYALPIKSLRTKENHPIFNTIVLNGPFLY